MEKRKTVKRWLTLKRLQERNKMEFDIRLDINPEFIVPPLKEGERPLKDLIAHLAKITGVCTNNISTTDKKWVITLDDLVSTKKEHPTLDLTGKELGRIIKAYGLNENTPWDIQNEAALAIRDGRTLELYGIIPINQRRNYRKSYY